MAKYSKKIPGAITGSFGDLVGGSWRGEANIRTRPAKPKNAKPSFKQLIQRKKFNVAVEFVEATKLLVNVGYATTEKGKFPAGNAMSHVMRNALVGKDLDWGIDLSKVLISRGDLPNAEATEVIAATEGNLIFNWQDNTGVGSAHSTDHAILAMYCAKLKTCIFSVAKSTRSSKTGLLNAEILKGEQVATYIAFISPDGKKIAPSIYTGMLTVPE